MAGVFLSYDRDDTDKARPIALALEKAGHSVWWDLHVRGGAQFGKVIEEALKAADAVVVLWSAHSVESAWVKDEAAAGRDSGRLVPVTIDGTAPPLGFRQFQTIDLSRWKGCSRSAQLAGLLADIESMEKRPTAAPVSTEPAKARSIFKFDWRIVAVAAAIILAAGIALWQPWVTRETVPSVVVNAAANDPYSQALARDLIVKLGSLQSVHSAPIRLLNKPDSSAKKSDLILEVGRLADANAVGANVALMTGRDRAILWSTDFQEASRNLADLKQQIAYTAGRVLGCTSDGLTGTSKPLRQETLKLYLNACAQLSEMTYQVPPVVPALLQVIRQAPRFEAAWKLLLHAESDQAWDEHQEGGVSSALRSTLRDHVTQARKLDPQMAEATIAEIALLPPSDVVKAMQLIDEAKQNSPEDPVVLSNRSIMLRSVGRMSESIGDASRAIELDPLSPLLHGTYFAALIYGASFEAAEQELRRVEQLWPGSSTLRDMQFRYHLRFGDPKIARALLPEDTFEGERLFLTARADPTPENINRYIAYALRMQRNNSSRLVWLMQGLGEFHREDELFNIMMTWPRPSDFAWLQDAWFRPPLKKFRENPRFMRVAARSPLLKYWQSTGYWPDFCEAPSLPYDCKKEAAKWL